MSLFFDATWFDARLESLGLSRADLALALGLTALELDELWKDQRELKAAEVRMLAALLATSPAEIAGRAGISTPLPTADAADGADALRRIERIEAELLALKQEVANLKKRPS